MLYTGYFAKTKKYIEAGLSPVSIAGVTPAFFTYKKYTIFAPRKELFLSWKYGDISNEEYLAGYNNYLSSVMTPAKIENLIKVASNKDVVMCCYEKYGDFCHRHELARWINENTELFVEEYII